MKTKKLLFIPLVLASLVSCSSTKSPSFKKIGSEIPFSYYEDASSSYKALMTAFSDSRMSARKIDFDDDAEYSSLGPSSYALKIKDSKTTIINLNDNSLVAEPEGTFSFYGAESSYSTFIGYINLYNTLDKSGNNVLHILPLEGEEKNFTSETAFTVTNLKYTPVTKTYPSSFVDLYFKFEVFSDSVDEIVYADIGIDYENYNYTFSFIDAKDYFSGIDNKKTDYYSNGKYLYTSSGTDYVLIYNKKDAYVGAIDFSSLPENLEYDYTAIETNTCCYYVRTYEYTDHVYDSSSETKYRTEAYKVDYKNAKVSYMDNLDFALGSDIQYSYYDDETIKNVFVSYYKLSDGVKESDLYCAKLDDDFSSLDGSYIYNQELFSSLVKVGKGAYLTVDGTYKYITKNNSVTLNDIASFMDFTDEGFFYEDGNDINKYISYNNFMTDYNNSLSSDATVIYYRNYINEGKVVKAVLDKDADTYIFDNGLKMKNTDTNLNYFYNYALIITEEGLYDLSGNKLCDLSSCTVSSISTLTSYYDGIKSVRILSVKTLKGETETSSVYSYSMEYLA